VRTDRTIPSNKPYTINRDNEKEHVLKDTVISGFRNMIKKEAKKILKYKRLTTEIKLMWNVKKFQYKYLNVTGTITKSFRKYVDTPGKHIKKLQKKQPIWHDVQSSESTNI
jgi:hypothetical protein